MNQIWKDKMRNFAPTLLRVGIALVFLWFGTQQLTNTEMWTRMIPDWAVNVSGMTAASLVQFNGTFEVVFGSLLLLGLFTRTVSFLLSLHMLHIMFTVGYGGIGVRDFGLAMATIAIFLRGVDAWSLDRYLRKTN